MRFALVLLLATSFPLMAGQPTPTAPSISAIENGLNRIIQFEPGSDRATTASKQLRKLIQIRLQDQGNLQTVIKAAANAGPDNYLVEGLSTGEIVRWTSQPIPVFLQPPHALTPDKGQDIVSATIRGLAHLQKATHGIIRFRLTEQANNAQIIFDWVSQIEDTAAQGSILGNTTIRTAGDTIIEAQIKIAPFTKEGREITPNEMEAIAKHEGIHALGISGHSPHTNSLMFYRYNPSHPQPITSADLATIQALYRLTPSVTDRPNLTHDQRIKFLEAYAAGIALENRGENGLPSLETAVRLNPTDGNAHYILGCAHLKNGRYETARATMQQAVILSPNRPRHHVGLATAILNSALRRNDLTPEQVEKEKQAIHQQLQLALQSNPAPEFVQSIKQLQNETANLQSRRPPR